MFLKFRQRSLQVVIQVGIPAQDEGQHCSGAADNITLLVTASLVSHVNSAHLQKVTLSSRQMNTQS